MDLAAVLLAVACAIAVFRFRVGMVPVLLASSLAGAAASVASIPGM